MISAIILAAGQSRRMKKDGHPNKLLLQIGDKKVIEHTADHVLASRVDEVYAVLGCKHDPLFDLLQPKGIHIVINDARDQGQSTSLVAGLNAIHPSSEGAIFFLADQPFVAPGLINHILKVFQDKKDQKCQVIYPVYQGVRGNPVLFHRDLFPSLRAVRGDKGGRSIIESLNKQDICQVVTRHKGVLMDIDTLEDYKQALAYYRQGPMMDE